MSIPAFPVAAVLSLSTMNNGWTFPGPGSSKNDPSLLLDAYAQPDLGKMCGKASGICVMNYNDVQAKVVGCQMNQPLPHRRNISCREKGKNS
jgi:hypothetical protein